MLFRIEEVHKSFGGHDVLRGITLQVNPGDKAGLVGRNGAGKSTIFRLITGYEEPDDGQIVLLKNLRIGLLEQQPLLSSSKTVRDEALDSFSRMQEMEAEMTRLENHMSESSGTELAQSMEAYSELQHRYELEG